MKSAQLFVLLLLAAALSACGSSPKPPMSRDTVVSPSQPSQTTTRPAEGRGAYLPGDGPAEQTPVDLDKVPDAVPRPEPLHPWANRPYKALGKQYTPQLNVDGNFRQRGIASWYGRKFHGQATSSGETYDMFGMTAAHPTLPIPSYVRVRNVQNGKSVVVRINDRGPFLRERVIDLSYVAAHRLGIIENGSSEVELSFIVPDGSATQVAVTPAPNKLLVQTSTLADSSEVKTSKLAAEPVLSNTGVFLQLGAFRLKSGAESFMDEMRQKLAAENKNLSLHTQDQLVKVFLGPYANHVEAKQGASRLESLLGFRPVLNLVD